MSNFENCINMPCKIMPFENLKGIIIGVYITKKGIEYEVRYYMNGEQKTNYFFDWEIDESEDAECQK